MKLFEDNFTEGWPTSNAGSIQIKSGTVAVIMTELSETSAFESLAVMPVAIMAKTTTTLIYLL